MSGGTTVTISGTGFTGATQVLFGKTAAASFTVNSATSITAVSPAVTRAGVVDVKVTNPAGTSVVGSPDSFTYAAASPPTVTGISPAGGPIGGGTTVTITGTAGDTALDGATTGTAGDWNGIYASTSTAAVGVDHAVIRFTSTAVEVDNGVISVTNSAINRAAGSGVYAESPASAPTLTGNTTTDVAGYGIFLSTPTGVPSNTVTRAVSDAIEVDSANIDLAKLNNNNGSSNAINGVTLNSDIQTVTSTVTLTGTLVPVLLGGPGTLTVKAGVTLTLGAGSVVKAYGASLQVNGRLVTTGTTSNKVYLTSLRDDAVGGDTNNDGNATMPAAGDWQGIVLGSSGTTSLTNAVVRYN